MFTKLLSGTFNGIKKFITMERFVFLIVFLILMWALVMYSNNKSLVVDKMEGGVEADAAATAATAEVEPAPAEPATNAGYSTKETVAPKDLLPSDENSQWAKLNPAATGNGSGMPDLLKAGQHIGVDSIGQSLRNASHDIRPDPFITNDGNTGPWMQSTIEATPDFKKTLE
jgi:hypothetical protein